MSRRDPVRHRSSVSALLLALSIALHAIGCSGQAGEREEAGAADAQMSARCPADTPEFVATPEGGLLARGKNETVQVRVIAAMPATPERFMNDWTVRFMDPTGSAIAGVAISDVCVYMPVHGHGGAPREVAKTGEPGTVALNGLNLFMRGPWEIQLAVSASPTEPSAREVTSCDREARRPGSDLVRFRVCVPDD